MFWLGRGHGLFRKVVVDVDWGRDKKKLPEGVARPVVDATQSRGFGGLFRDVKLWGCCHVSVRNKNSRLCSLVISDEQVLLSR